MDVYMSTRRTLIHASTNDDRWFLCRDDDTADVFAFHEPNGPSGGMPHRISLASFLARDEGSPQYRALLDMIGGLVGSAHAGPPAQVGGPEPGAAAAEPTPGEEAAQT